MTSTDTQDTKTEAPEPELLLPWYATGQLTGEERAAVEAWLADNPDAQAHLVRVNEELELYQESAEKLGAPRAGSLDALMVRVALEAPPSTAEIGWIERIVEFLTPRVVGAMAAALVAVVAVQAVVIGALVTDRPAGFETASAPDRVIAGPTALIAFVPSASVADINALLETAQVQIVEGPKPGGVYRIAAAQENGAAARLLALEEDELVRFFAMSE